MIESETEQEETHSGEPAQAAPSGRSERLKLVLLLLASAVGLYVLPRVLLPQKSELPVYGLKAPSEQADRQFRAWAREQQSYAKTLRPPVDPDDEADVAAKTPSAAKALPSRPQMPLPQSNSPKQAQTQPAPPSKAMPKLSPRMAPKVAAKQTAKHNPVPEPKQAAKTDKTERPPSPNLSEALAGLKRLEAGAIPRTQTLPGLEGLSKGRSIDELSRSLEAMPGARAQSESLKYFLSRLRSLGLGEAAISNWAFVRDCRTGLPVPGFSARIQTPAFDVHYGLYFNSRGPGQFRVEPIDPERAGADQACPEPRSFDPMLERRRV